jgi:transposase
MGRLSTFAKNRILNLRFQKSYRIKQIAQTLLQENEIKVSRKSISTFLKKYIETKSINDKPRSGRNKKLTPEEINLIGELTRLNRDLTASKIKEYLNLNVSTYTILRASKQFEWNKMNPNSNEAKKAASIERKSNEEGGSTSKISSRRRSKKIKSDKINDNKSTSSNKSIKTEPINLNLISDIEIDGIKKISSSPMVFATKILFKIFNPEELIGRNVTGKTFSKIVKEKKPLDEERIGYIRWLIENNFESNNKDDLWRSCRTAINKCIRFNELRCMKKVIKKEIDDDIKINNDSNSNQKMESIITFDKQINADSNINQQCQVCL